MPFFLMFFAAFALFRFAHFQFSSSTANGECCEKTQPTRSKAKFQLNETNGTHDGRTPSDEQQTETEIQNTHTHTHTRVHATGRGNTNSFVLLMSL